MLNDQSTALSIESRLNSSKYQRSKLVAIKALSYGKPDSGNMLIHGDNLKALIALLPNFEGRVRCVYIDPPYNNQERYSHYRDDLDHETWLSTLTLRLELIARLLSVDGSLWISLDDREVHYLKVAADKIFGRHNFVSTIIWQQRTTRENRKVFSNDHEYVLVYAKNGRRFGQARNGLPLPPELRARYKNPDKDLRGPWQSISANVQAGHATRSQFYTFTSPNGKRHSPPNGRCWIYTKSKMLNEVALGNVWFGHDGSRVPRLKRFLRDSDSGVTPETLWLAQKVGTNDEAKKHLLQIFPGQKVFDTPKPERLVERIIYIASNPGDLVLDAYLGSGTTAAVAHKMNRRYIGVEQGAEAIKLCSKRLKRVIDGEADGFKGWNGGGGFGFYRVK
jgi:adenine-specific DNA-methyltransferase